MSHVDITNADFTLLSLRVKAPLVICQLRINQCQSENNLNVRVDFLPERTKPKPVAIQNPN